MSKEEGSIKEEGTNTYDLFRRHDMQYDPLNGYSKYDFRDLKIPTGLGVNPKE